MNIGPTKKQTARQRVVQELGKIIYQDSRVTVRLKNDGDIVRVYVHRNDKEPTSGKAIERFPLGYMLGTNSLAYRVSIQDKRIMPT